MRPSYKEDEPIYGRLVSNSGLRAEDFGPRSLDEDRGTETEGFFEIPKALTQGSPRFQAEEEEERFSPASAPGSEAEDRRNNNNFRPASFNQVRIEDSGRTILLIVNIIIEGKAACRHCHLVLYLHELQRCITLRQNN